MAAPLSTPANTSANTPLTSRPAPALTLAVAGEPTPKPLLPPSPFPSTAQLSPLARGLMDLIASLLPGTASPGKPAALPQTAAALFMEGMPPEALQQALKQTVEKSGLFYESHLRQMTAGQRSPAQMREEPQGQLPPQPPTAGQQPAIPAEARPLVQAQLQLIEQQALLWRGEAWPGIPMEWRIEREAPEREPSAESTGERAWQMALNLDFPTLGEIAARLRLCAGQIDIDLEGAARDDFLSHLPELMQRLQDRGLKTHIHVHASPDI